jgi:RNA recognition motif-containing protein
MGFGFVEFYTPEDAANLLKNGSNIKIDGHILELKLSQKNSRPKRVIIILIISAIFVIIIVYYYYF